MPPLRQPLPMAALAEQLVIDMAAEAGEGLVSTPGDPMHAVVIARLEAAVRELPEEAAVRLSQAVLLAVDKALVYEELDRAWSELFVFMAARALGPLPVRPRRGRRGLVSELASFAALSAPVDEETAHALLTVAAACLPDHFTKVDSTELSAASTAAVMAQLPRMSRLESLRLTKANGAGLLPGVLYPLARALHAMPGLSVVSLAQSATDNVLRVLAQACPDTLEELDVSRSSAVTDKGVTALTACTNLRVLKLTRTAVTAVGAERVLRGCPWLQKLGNIPDLGRAVAAAARSEAGRVSGRRGSASARGKARERAGQDDVRERGELQLRSFRSDRPPPLDVLAEHCPRLDDITICLSEDAEYCEPLPGAADGETRQSDDGVFVCPDRMSSFGALHRSVPGLARLRVTCDDGVANDVMAELLDWPEDADDAAGADDSGATADETRSSTPSAAPDPPMPQRLDNLVELKLCGTVLAAWDLHVIGHVCPRLQQLTLVSTPPSPDPRHQRPLRQPLPEDAFRSLRVLQTEDLLPEAELLVLSRAVALEEVYISHWDPGARRMSFSEEAFLDALQGNPLLQLRTFCVDEAPFLGERAAWRLLECPELKELATLRSWDGLGPGTLQHLQSVAAYRNLDVIIQ
ncbi:uncharacterized protein LOC117649484 [Thrips palmi]|uniref:Uncharacterized protein LOC117649484 n=1 Tax=Thrips palmi TaxID=161013 RepID=A0A6P8ZSL3_THRPL|nr:uncharacterized protein LOC117649484 [Thrips palmi]